MTRPSGLQDLPDGAPGLVAYGYLQTVAPWKTRVDTLVWTVRSVRSEGAGTAVPTMQPSTTAPTAEPSTAAPTAAPSPAPTAEPSTTAPTAEPSTAAPTAEPSTAVPMAAPSPAPAMVPTREDIAAGHVFISRLHTPAVLCAGGNLTAPTSCSLLSAAQEAAIVQVTGSVRIEHAGTDAAPALAGRFPGLQLVRGDFRVLNTYLTALSDGAFGALETVEGDFQLHNNPSLRIINGSAFGNLTTVGGGFKLNNNPALQAINGPTFGALVTVEGVFQLTDNTVLQAINGTAFGALASVGGDFQLSQVQGKAANAGDV